MTADPFHVEVVRCGPGFADLVHAGTPIRRVRLGRADYYAGIEEKRLRIAKTGGNRPCLCCGHAFESEGPHNRMCKDCRDRGGPPAW